MDSQVQKGVPTMDEDSLTQYQSRLDDKKDALDAIDRQIEVLNKAREKRQQDYDDELIRQEMFANLWDERQKHQAKLEKLNQGTTEWYSVFSEIEKIDKNIRKALRGWKKFW